MNTETDMARIEKKLDEHIVRHDQDYKKLMMWVVSTLVGLILASISMFVTYGQTLEKVSQLENQINKKVERQELSSVINLFDEKFSNINEKLDDIKQGLKIK